MRRPDIDERKDEIIAKLKAGESRSSVSRWLKCKETTLKNRLELWGVVHLKNQGGKGHLDLEKRKPIEYYLENITKVSSHELKLKLFDCGLKEKVCEICNNDEWNGKPIPLELDHIDGNPINNKLENLRILCPNCHAQTPNYKIKNRKWKPIKSIKKCQECNSIISSNAKKCSKCAPQSRTKITWPPHEELKMMISNTSLSEVARILGVSDNGVRKHCKNHNIMA